MKQKKLGAGGTPPGKFIAFKQFYLLQLILLLLTTILRGHITISYGFILVCLNVSDYSNAN